MTKIYRVTVERTVVQEYETEIEADDEGAAEKEAIETCEDETTWRIQLTHESPEVIACELVEDEA